MRKMPSDSIKSGGIFWCERLEGAINIEDFILRLFLWNKWRYEFSGTNRSRSS